MQAEDVTKVVDREPEPPDGDPLPDATQAVRKTDVVEAHSPAPGRRPTAESKLDHVETGRVLVGRYELLHRLGHGGMASVYLGRAIGTAGFERLVAVKVIHPHLASESEFVDMFLDEARIAAKIHHPNVCETLDLGEDDGLFFMVMEYVEGETLASLVRQLRKTQERLSVGSALQIAADACRGLSAAHALEDNDGTSLGLVHRDVSPHNLLVTMDGRVKVVDFGIMKAAGKRSSTLTGQLRGKLTYMSPEQARGEPVDRRSDIYAVGVILWELLAGDRFYRGQTDSELLAQVSLGRKRDLGEFRDDLPASVTNVLERSLAESRGDRYDTAEDMLKDLRGALRLLLDASEDDPREVLGGVMDRFFAGRMRYIQAAARGQGEERDLRKLNRAANDSKNSAVDVRTMTPSSVALGRTGTLTSSVASAPARSWALWLILPLAGAALGTAAVRAMSSDEASVRRTAPVEAPPASAASQLVKWWINTDPQGATVSIDGVPLEGVTPTSVELPRSDETVLVTLELAGYKSRELQVQPLSPENHSWRLEPSYKTTFTAREPGEEPASADAQPKPRKDPRKRPRKRPPQPPEEPPAAKPVSTAADPPADVRKPEDVPDFLKGKNQR